MGLKLSLNSQNKIQTCIKLGGRTKWYTYLQMHAHSGAGAADANAVCQLNHAASGCSPGVFLFSLGTLPPWIRHQLSDVVDMGNWCGCSITSLYVEAPCIIESQLSDMQRGI